jgi:hypothetical protein
MVCGVRDKYRYLVQKPLNTGEAELWDSAVHVFVPVYSTKQVVVVYYSKMYYSDVLPVYLSNHALRGPNFGQNSEYYSTAVQLYHAVLWYTHFWFSSYATTVVLKYYYNCSTVVAPNREFCMYGYYSNRTWSSTSTVSTPVLAG